MNTLKAIIFDLDNCLAPAQEVGKENYSAAFDVMRATNNGILSEDKLNKAFNDVWRHPLDWVASTYNFPEAMYKAGWNEFSRMRVNHKMSGYGDLNILNELPFALFLVTSGFRVLQESKIEALGTSHLFTQVFIDAIDEPTRIGKKGLFEKIMIENSLTASQILIAGDNCESEIAAGNQLGMITVQTLRPDVPECNSATFTVTGLKGLRDLCLKINKN